MVSCEDREITWKISEQAQDRIHSQPTEQTLLELGSNQWEGLHTAKPVMDDHSAIRIF